MAGRGERQREGGGGPFGEPLADEYGSFLPHKQFSASAVAQLKRRCSPTSASSSSSSSATTPPPDDPSSSHSRSLHKDKPSLPASGSKRGSSSSSSSSSGGGDDTAGTSTSTSTSSSSKANGAAAGRPSSSSPLKLVQEMVSMPFGSPLVSPLRDGPVGAASPVRSGLEELSAHSPPMVVAGGEAADGDSPARMLRHRQQRNHKEGHSPTTNSPPSRERSPTSSSAGEAHKRKREAPPSHDRPRRASDAAASSSLPARAAAGGEQQHKGRGREPEPKRVKRDAGGEELLRDREAKEPRDSRERTSPRESKERRDSDPRPDLRERREQQRHKERERARGSERSAPPKDESLPKERTTRPAAAAAAKTTAPKPSAKPQMPFSKEGGSAGPQAADKLDQVGAPSAGEAHSSRGSTTTTTNPLSNGLKSEANTLKRAADKAMKTDGAHEALGLYIEAGLKYLQCCHQLEQEATEHNSPLKNAAHMYKRTAKFFDDILKIAAHDKDKLRASVCHRCVSVALARAFCLKKDSMRHAQKDLQAQLKRVPVLSLPTTPDASCGSPQLTDSSPSASMVSKARPGAAAADMLSSTFRQHALSFFEEMDDMFKALDAWQKAETARTEAERSGSAMAAVVFPVTLDSFLLHSLAQAPTSQVVDYVHQAINQPAHHRR